MFKLFLALCLLVNVLSFCTHGRLRGPGSDSDSDYTLPGSEKRNKNLRKLRAAKKKKAQNSKKQKPKQIRVKTYRSILPDGTFGTVNEDDEEV